MSDSSIEEAAKRRDVNAISSIVSQALVDDDVRVEAEILYGYTLWLKLNSLTTLNPETCTQTIIKALNPIQPSNISLVRISEMSSTGKGKQSWNKFLALEGRKFVDSTKTLNRITCGVIAILGCGIGWMILTNKPDPTPSTNPVASQERKLLGTGPTGYTLWLGNDGCTYVKNLTEADLQRLQTSAWEFKKAIKEQTGSQCVFFE